MPHRFTPLLEDVDKHYDYILGLFDRALAKLDSEEAGRTECTSTAQRTSAPSFSGRPCPVLPSALAQKPAIATLEDTTPPSSSAGYQSTVLSSLTGPADPSPLVVSLNRSSRGSKRRSEEAELEEEAMKGSKRRCECPVGDCSVFPGSDKWL